ncbi:hypothetical protein Rumeso_03357 [Rubellimicrobium mesophilum DSM 19309]|uniref:Uncharacterized protein n=1 Tax=Rubellimicrobium mesophilum DSM 19309 TaxID=442562 RepID=A0A017HMP5_9RHOB|nr:hypothetical protein Rumeso_03357 [Rubellimicrobium mesophilum DSM 19309]
MPVQVAGISGHRGSSFASLLGQDPAPVFRGFLEGAAGPPPFPPDREQGSHDGTRQRRR